MKRTIRVGSRESKLAVVQATMVIQRLQQEHPEFHYELVTMKTTGDVILDRNLDQVGGKGLFVKELDIGLRAGQIDVAVHSLKDMPMVTPEDLPLIAFTARENPFDALIMPSGTLELDLTKPFGCSSPRRTLQLQKLYPGLTVSGIRGNVQLRLQKLDSGAFAATVLACAGLNRLGLESRITRVFTPDEMLPAAGQGILAIQARAGEDTDYLRCLDDPAARIAATAERAFVRRLDGGCSSPIAAFAELQGDRLLLRGLHYEPSTNRHVTGSLTGTVQEAEALGIAMAETLLKEI